MSGQSGNKVSQDWKAERDSPSQPLSPQSPSPAATTHLQPLVPERRPVYDASSSATSSMKPSVVSLPAGTPVPAPAENQLGPKGSDSKSCPSLPGSSSERSRCETPSPGVPSHPQRKGRGCWSSHPGPSAPRQGSSVPPPAPPLHRAWGQRTHHEKERLGGWGRGQGRSWIPGSPRPHRHRALLQRPARGQVRPGGWGRRPPQEAGGETWGGGTVFWDLRGLVGGRRTFSLQILPRAREWPCSSPLQTELRGGPGLSQARRASSPGLPGSHVAERGPLGCHFRQPGPLAG